ncbi:hypothetical protein [Enterococcus camelliae]|uniref:Glycosyltransferase RgtA/B/C/D-like domain-containing protein n=1 Tax=Enterococcus camelliae TaxID=453959 RepID=A0ABW5TJN3_9ENTE
MCSIKKNYSSIILFFILLILTLGRFVIQMKILPVTYVGGGVDEHVFVNQAINILKGKWFGDYNSITLVKNPMYSFFYVFVNKVGLSYPIALIGFYIVSILIFILAIFPIIKNKYYLSFTYVFLLYSPVMLDKKFGFRLYRDALLSPLVLLVIASLIGLYLYRNKCQPILYMWGILSGISFFIFSYLREDAIWLKPFFFGALLITCLFILFEKKSFSERIIRMIACLIPFLILYSFTSLLSQKNKEVYGVAVVNDHTETYFRNVITDLIAIDDGTNQEYVWVHEDALRQAFEVSPTLKKLEEQFDSFYIDNSTLTTKVDSEGQAEIFSGKIVWLMRLAVERAGLGYKPYVIVDGKQVRGAVATNNFYKKVHKELSVAFEDGSLKKRTKGIAISSSAPAKTSADIINNVIPKVLYSTKQTVFYENYFINEDIRAVNGDSSKVREIEMLINSPLNYPVSSEQSIYNRPITKMIPRVNFIINLYRGTVWTLIVTSLIGMLYFIFCLFNRNFQEHFFGISIINLGLIASYFILLIGVSWAYSWVSGDTMNRLYFYTSGAVPVLQIFYVINCYGFVKLLTATISKYKVKK